MKRVSRLVLVALWIVIATGLLTRWWLVSPNAGVFHMLPDSFWKWLILDVFGDANRKGDAAILVGLTFSLFLVTSLTSFGWFLYRRIRLKL